MLRNIFPVIFALAIALAGGIYSVDYTTNRFEGFGALQYGQWVAYPQNGSSNADPYARARAARTGRIPLGSVEGLAFTASKDKSENDLRAECTYLITGKTPPARTWTLRMVDEGLFPIGSIDVGNYALSANNLLWNKDGSFAITISSTAASGNWLQSSGIGKRKLVMTLYDTSVASTTGVSEIVMPEIILERC